MEAREAVAPQPQSPWHSPVPYLFGGLSAMLGLIAFALLILACSYWKLSGYLDNGDGNSRNRDLEAAGTDDAMKKEPQHVIVEEKILVIMPGGIKPTFIATPVSSTRTCSFFGHSTTRSSNCTRSANGESSEVKQEASADVLVHERNLHSHETSHHTH